MKNIISFFGLTALSIISFSIFNSFIINDKKFYSDDWSFKKARQFDFWIGEWYVNNRFRQDDNSWKDEGEGYLKVWPVLDGKAIMEFWDGTGRNNNLVKGFSLRYYDKAQDKWIVCLNWPQPNNGGFFFLTGNFRFNRGEIFNQYPNQNGRLIKSRFTFSDITDTSYRWNDGSSLDTGKTWRTNWIMENFRKKNIPEWPNPNETFHSYSDDSYSTSEESKRFHFLEGNWKGTISDSTNNGTKIENIELNGWKTQNGISMFYELKSESNYEEVGMLTYRELNKVWLSMRLDDKTDSGIITKLWKETNNELKFDEYSQLYSKSTTEIDKYKINNENKFEILRYTIIDSTQQQISKQLIKLKKEI